MRFERTKFKTSVIRQGKRYLSDRRGNIVVMAALTLPIVLSVMALGIDYGNLTLQNRTMQGEVDIAAIVASSNIADPEHAVLNYFVSNGVNAGVRTGNSLLTAAGTVTVDDASVFTGRDGYALVKKGHYVADGSLAVAQRFQPNALPNDAVQVTLVEKGTLFFAGSFASPPVMGVKGTAAVQQLASISIGSRAASLNGGMLNAVLGALLGTTVSLDVMSYQSLIDADVSLLQVLDFLAADVGVTAGSYDDLLATNITYSQLLKAVGKATGLSPSVAAIVNGLQKTVNKTTVNLNLREILNLGPVGARLVGQGDTFSVKTDVFSLINAAAVAANGGNQVSVDLGAAVPGLLSAKAVLAVGEPPAATPMANTGMPGTTVRTAQTRLSIVLQTTGVGDLLGVKIRLPVYVDVAYAEGQLSAIRCAGTGRANGDVDVKVVPGLASVAVGDVDQTAFANFGTKPRVSRATLVQVTPLLSLSALASVDTGNLAAKTVTFSSFDIAAGKVVTVSSNNTLTALVSSLLGNLQLRVDLIGLPIVVPSSLLSGLSSVLSGLTVPLDSVLFNLLAVLGVHIGEADVRALGVSCTNPALVQ